MKLAKCTMTEKGYTALAMSKCVPVTAMVSGIRKANLASRAVSRRASLQARVVG